MATGDKGGIVQELILTCMTPIENKGIYAGDLVVLTGDRPYEVSNHLIDDDESPYPPMIFGSALRTVTESLSPIPVVIRGVVLARISTLNNIEIEPGDGICMASGGSVIGVRPNRDLRGTILKNWGDGTVDVLL